MALTKATNTGGAYFEPKEHTSDLIIVIEGKKFLRDQPATDYTTKQPITRDVVVADIYCFRDSADIEMEEPSVVLINAQITHGVLVSDCVENGWVGTGDAGMTTVARPKGTFFAWRNDYTPEAEAAAVAWYEKREAARAAAIDDMPEV